MYHNICLIGPCVCTLRSVKIKIIVELLQLKTMNFEIDIFWLTLKQKEARWYTCAVKIVLQDCINLEAHAIMNI